MVEENNVLSRPMPKSSIAASVFGAIGIGLMVGAILGLAYSPVVGAFIGAVGTALAALLGLNDQHFSTAKGLRIGAFGFAVLIAAPTGIYVRDHALLAPEQQPPKSLADKKAEYMALGFTEQEVKEMLALLIVRRERTPAREADQSDEAKTKRAPGGLHATEMEISTCSELDNDEYDELDPETVINNFWNWIEPDKPALKKWQPLLEGIRDLPLESQKRVLFVARDAGCGLAEFDKPLLPSPEQCRASGDDVRSFEGMDEAWEQVVKQIKAAAPGRQNDVLIQIGEFLCR